MPLHKHCLTPLGPWASFSLRFSFCICKLGLIMTRQLRGAVNEMIPTEHLEMYLVHLVEIM